MSVGIFLLKEKYQRADQTSKSDLLFEFFDLKNIRFHGVNWA